jgi:hypothetical protein
MDCWPANLVGVFFLVLLISDVYYSQYMDMPFHAIVGIIGTLFFWLVCSVLGETIASSVLVVPGIFLLFYLAIGYWSEQIIKANTPPPPFEPECPKPCPDVCPPPPVIDTCPPPIDDNCGADNSCNPCDPVTNQDIDLGCSSDSSVSDSTSVVASNSISTSKSISSSKSISNSTSISTLQS